ncbi:hypothetical protein GH810_11920 [Acetobacterium paludosum]|uniref:Glycosyl-4,4'-diaponeurosporenoate acyltransferase n=1 Tax=Acetobacterium paludosum TaxID=52693 RepID=A0A923HVG9_9FIRM|nr:hypothetical protein [Acetobacterium paludosum]MBC3889021.1 hypothetical protein [Acetobacterium paludosum]
MQIIFLPKAVSILLCFILWPIFQIVPAVVCLNLPERFFSSSSYFYQTHKWEKNGLIYKQLFKVNKWKRFLPESSALIKGSYNKKSLESFSKASMNQFLLESCRAEMIHLLAILPFWVFGLFTPPMVIFWMLIYALTVNLPCIIVQRYNRPRIIRLLEKKTMKSCQNSSK